MSEFDLVDDENHVLWGILGSGTTAFVSLYDEGTVLKGYVVYHNGSEVAFFRGDSTEHKTCLDREDQIYDRIGIHPNILRYYGTVEIAPGIYSLRLEYAARRDLRSLIHLKQKSNPESLQTRLKWVCDIASALTHIHSRGVVHNDVSCRNILLDSKNVVKLADFGGANMDDQEPLGAAETRYGLPLRGRTWKDMSPVKEEIFAFGCAIYEIMAWEWPYHMFTDDEVNKLYASERFPDLTGLPLAGIIRRCWTESYNTLGEVEEGLRASTLCVPDNPA